VAFTCFSAERGAGALCIATLRWGGEMKRGIGAQLASLKGAHARLHLRSPALLTTRTHAGGRAQAPIPA